MKTLILTAGILAAVASQAAEAYTFVNDAKGYSYIQFNEDVDAFSFNSDFKSIGNSGKVGVYTYPDGLDGQALADYIKSVPADNAIYGKKPDGLVELGAHKAGDRVGFYLERKNGAVIRLWDFETKNGTTYIAFDKNGGGKDEWMSIGNVTVTKSGSRTAGAPLPGALVMLALGGLGVGGLKLRRRGKQAA